MNYRSLLRVFAVIEILFGLALVAAPDQLVALYGLPAMEGVGLYNSMLLGAFLLGLAVMNWSASNSEAYKDVRFVILGNLAINCLGFAVALWRQLVSEWATPPGWLNVVIFLAGAIAFSVIYFGARAERGAGSGRPLHG